MQCELFEEELGRLELSCDLYVVMSIDIGSPAVRDVVRNRSLADGTLDDTRFLGARALTVSIKFNDVTVPYSMQDLVDLLTPFMSPRRRPTLTWQLPRSTESRAAIVRGANWPWTFAGPKAQTIALQWVVPTGEILLGGPYAQRCTTISPSTDVEAGRTYDLTFDRVYPAALPLGSRLVQVDGTMDSHWTLTIFGPVTNPKFTVNGVTFAADRRGGVALTVGQTLNVSTRDRTVLLNNDPTTSRYQFVNFEDWSWDDLKLHPGDNAIVFGGTAMSVQTAAELCHTPTFL